MNKLNIRSFTKDELESFFMNVKEKKLEPVRVLTGFGKIMLVIFTK